VPAARLPEHMSYFAYPTAAERYANGRPFVHRLVMEKIRTVRCESGRINQALDVACGTGQSTVALPEVGDEIVGMDNSAEMLSRAIHDARICYVKGRAEQMPFGDAAFGLMTVALALHWFDRRQFMIEARRVLRPGGWLVIYTDGFYGRMIGNEKFETWNRDKYLVRYPTPPRNNQPLTDADVLAYGFVPSGFDKFDHEVEFTPEQLVNYLLTQTNVISAVEMGSEELQAVAQWLLFSVQPLFIGITERFHFGCQIQFLKRG
jgi:SAM-dependent methyltransferase